MTPDQKAIEAARECARNWAYAPGRSLAEQINRDLSLPQLFAIVEAATRIEEEYLRPIKKAEAIDALGKAVEAYHTAQKENRNA